MRSVWLIVLVGSCFTCGRLAAQTVVPVNNFIGLPDGGVTEWSDAGNWSLGEAPTPSQIGSINFDDAYDRTIVFSQSVNGGTFIATNSGGGELVLDEPVGIDLNFQEEVLGDHGAVSGTYAASFVQVGGTNSVDRIYIGGRGGTGDTSEIAAGTYTLIGGTLQTTDFELGSVSNGTFVQVGGTVHVGGTSSYMPTGGALAGLATAMVGSRRRGPCSLGRFGRSPSA